MTTAGFPRTCDVCTAPEVEAVFLTTGGHPLDLCAACNAAVWQRFTAVVKAGEQG